MKPSKSTMQILVFVEILALIVVLVFAIGGQLGIFRSMKTDVSTNTSQETDPDNEILMSTETMRNAGADQAETDQTGENGSHTGGELSDEVLAKVESMTLEEKAAQIFMITPEQLTGMGQVIVAGDMTEEAVNNYPVGGLFYASGNFEDKTQTTDMLNGVNQFSRERIGVGMFLTVEEEGGEDYSPLAKANGYEILQTPLELGEAGDTEAAKNSADTLASYMSEEGFNFSLSTITDLAAGADAAYDERTFGADEAAVSELAGDRIASFLEHGFVTAVKYFPEKSSAETQAGGTLTGALVSTKTLAEHESSDFAVCQAGIDAGAGCVVLANVVDEELTGDTGTLCSMSEEAVRYLREQMGFAGIIMTDSFREEAVTDNFTPEEAAVAAINAGVDMICMPEDFEAAYQGILDAVNDGSITEEQLDNAVGHILMQKMN